MSKLGYCQINQNISSIICLKFSSNELQIFDTILHHRYVDTSTLRNDVQIKKYVKQNLIIKEYFNELFSNVSNVQFVIWIPI